ncbi:MAG: HD domain-containing protein [Candidatus Pacearchaeota archaeon]
MENQKHEENIQKIIQLVQNYAPILHYHNATHALEVWNIARQYALSGKINCEDKQALEVAALLHDIIVVPGKQDNEEKSADFAEAYTRNLGYSFKQTDTAKRLILATKMPQNPKSYLEELICDSDLDNLGRPDFLIKGDLLRQELELPENVDWYKRQLDFIKNHNYFTDLAKNFRNPVKLENIEKLKDIIILQKKLNIKREMRLMDYLLRVYRYILKKYLFSKPS